MEVASVRGWWSILGSATPRNHSSPKAAWIWFVNAPGMKWPASGMAPMAVKCQYSSLASVPGHDANVSGVLNGNKGAASSSFFQVLSRVLIQTISLFLL